MGIGYILAGIIFLFEPFINIVDILPDFIGYLLILRGISKMADIEHKMFLAKTKLTHALAVACGRFAVMLLGLVSDFDNTLILLFAFSFAVLEFFFVLPAFNALFDGLEYLQLRYSPSGISVKTENVAKLTPIFISVRSICAVLPELTALKTEYGYVTSEGITDWTGTMRTMLIAICAGAALVFGLVWLADIRKALIDLKQNNAFWALIEEKYETEVVPDESKAIKKTVKAFWRLWLAGSFFLLFISIDFYYVIPDFVFGIFAFFAFLCAAQYTENVKKAKTLCIAFSAVMLLEYVLLLRYSNGLGGYLFPYETAGFWGYYIPYAIPCIAGCILLIVIFGYGKKTMDSLLADCVGYRAYTDTRKKETDGKRRSALAVRTKRLYIKSCIFAVASTGLTLAIPWFSLSWAVRSVLCFFIIMSIYYIMSDVFAEAEKVL
jgi:hypothetical protein